MLAVHFVSGFSFPPLNIFHTSLGCTLCCVEHFSHITWLYFVLCWTFFTHHLAVLCVVLNIFHTSLGYRYFVLCWTFFTHHFAVLCVNILHTSLGCTLCCVEKISHITWLYFVVLNIFHTWLSCTLCCVEHFSHITWLYFMLCWTFFTHHLAVLYVVLNIFHTWLSCTLCCVEHFSHDMAVLCCVEHFSHITWLYLLSLHTCEPIQFPGIKYIFFFILGGYGHLRKWIQENIIFLLF